MNLSSKREIIKHSGATQVSGESSALERKVWNFLLLNAFDDLKKKDQFKIPLMDLLKRMNYNSNDYERIKDVLRKLSETRVEWNVLNKDKTDEWETSVLLAGAKIVDGVLTYGYNPLIKDRLSDPRIYAKLNAFEQTLIKSKYTQVFWELFRDYIGIGETPWIPVEKELRKLLGLTKDEYKKSDGSTDFKTLNRDVIKRSISQLNKISSVFVCLKTGIRKKREHRKISQLKFIIKVNTDNVGKIKELEKKFFKSLEQKSKQLQIPLGDQISNSELHSTLKNEFSVPHDDVVEIIKTRDEFQIQDSLEYVRVWRDSGKIKSSLPGFTISAIKGNWKIDPVMKKKKEANSLSRKKDLLFEQIEEIKHNVQAKRHEKVLLIMDKMSESELKKQKEDFNKKLEEGYYGESLGNFFKASGEKMVGYKGQFRFFIIDRFLPPLEEDLKNYAKAEGKDYEKLNKTFDELA